MMTPWAVVSRTDATRWFVHNERKGNVGDRTTLEFIEQPDVEYMLSPTGPIRRGINDESDLYAAVTAAMPAPRTYGEPPEWPAMPTGGAVTY